MPPGDRNPSTAAVDGGWSSYAWDVVRLLLPRNRAASVPSIHFPMPPSSRHHLTILPRIFLTAVLLSALATAPAAEVSREASAAYREKLAPLLTPRETAIRDTHEEVEKDAPGVTLLEEYLHYVDAQGRRIIVGQTVYKPLTEAGAKAAAEDIQT